MVSVLFWVLGVLLIMSLWFVSACGLCDDAQFKMNWLRSKPVPPVEDIADLCQRAAVNQSQIVSKQEELNELIEAQSALLAKLQAAVKGTASLALAGQKLTVTL